MKTFPPSLLLASCAVVAVHAASTPERASGVPETLSQREIDAVVAQIRSRADACAAQGGAYKGRIVVGAQVAPSGAVQSANVTQTSPANGAVASCIANAVRSATFPRTKNGASIALPFTF